jgi:hypothetical protein
MLVILSEAKNLIISMAYRSFIPFRMTKRMKGTGTLLKIDTLHSKISNKYETDSKMGNRLRQDSY